MTDSALLEAYVGGDGEAFRTLVARYVDMVHGAAVRQAGAGGEGRAEDVTQAVFLLLAQKAETLQGRASVGGWLFHATRLCARNARRGEIRRKHHEREAAMRMGAASTEYAALLPLLDEGIAALGKADRELIVLRHLQNRELTEIAGALGISVPAATKRTQRAVEKLRAWFEGRGNVVPGAAVAGMLLAESAHRAPAGVVGAAGTGSAAATVLAKSTAAALGALKAAIVVGVVLLVGAAGTAVWMAERGGRPIAATMASAPSAPAVADATVAEEAQLPGQPVVASFDLLLDSDAADALRAACKPVASGSKAYQAYVGPTGEVLKVLRAAVEGDQMIPPESPNVTFVALDPQRTNAFVLGLDYNTGFQGRMGRTYVFGLSMIEGGKWSLQRDGAGVMVRADSPGAKVESRDSGTQWQDYPGEIHFAGQIASGETAVFLREAGAPAGRPLVHAVVWQAFQAAEDQMPRVTAIQSAAAWISAGPTGARGMADRALVWQHGAPKAGDIVPAGFVRQLPNGATVRLIAVGHPRDTAFCWWSADGKAVDGDWTGYEVTLAAPRAVVIDWKAPLPGGHADVHWRNWFSSGRDSARYYEQGTGEVAYALGEETAPVEIGISAGPWEEVGVIHGARGAWEELQAGDVEVEIREVMPLFDGKGAMPVMRYRAPAETEVQVLAVDKAGKRFGDLNNPDVNTPWPGVRLGRPAERKWRELSPNMKIAPEAIDHYVVQRRRVEWTTFEGFAEAPAKSIAQPKAAQVAAIRDELELQAAVRAGQETEATRAKVAVLLAHADATTPGGVMALLIARGRAGDVAGVRALFAPDDARQAAVADEVARFITAHESLRVAAEKRFGTAAADAALLKAGLLADADEQLGEQWDVHGDHATEGAATSTFTMRRTAGTWKVDGASLTEKMGTSSARWQGLVQVREKMERGEYADVAAVAAAVRAAAEAGAK